MPIVTELDVTGTLEQLQAQVAALTQRLAEIEKGAAAVAPPPPVVAAPVAVTAAAPAITEEELLAISAAVAAYLGVRAHIRQIRLLSSNAWAQQGRVSIQASHSLNG